MVNITGLNKSLVLLTLWKHSKQQGMSFMGSFEPTLEDCQRQLDAFKGYADYFAGRVIKCNLLEDSFDPWGFDRDLGEGAAQAAVNTLHNN